MKLIRFFLIQEGSTDSISTVMNRHRWVCWLSSDLKDGVHALAEEHVQNVEDEEERELGREEREEPLRRVHVRLDARLYQVVPQVAQVVLDQPVQLVQPQVQSLEPILNKRKKTKKKQKKWAEARGTVSG